MYVRNSVAMNGVVSPILKKWEYYRAIYPHKIKSEIQDGYNITTSHLAGFQIGCAYIII